MMASTTHITRHEALRTCILHQSLAIEKFITGAEWTWGQKLLLLAQGLQVEIVLKVVWKEDLIIGQCVLGVMIMVRKVRVWTTSTRMPYVYKTKPF